MRLNLLQQVAHDLHILLRHGELLDRSTLIERQVEEVDALEGDVVVGASRASLATTDQSLQGAHLLDVDIALLLRLEELLDLIVHLRDLLVLAVHEYLVETIHEMHETCHLLIVHGNVA